MSLLDHIRQVAGRKRTPRPPAVDNPELLALLDQLAAEERRDRDELIEELLYDAIAERFAATENFQPWQDLTPRERQAAALACLGYTNQEIATRMVISNNTVKSHVRQVLRKFDVNSKSQLREALTGWDFRGWVDGQELWSDNGNGISSPG